MLFKRQWILTVGVLAVTPTVTMAGLFSKKEAAPPAAATAPAVDNQQVANMLAGELKQAKLSGEKVKITYENGVASISGKILNAQQRETVTQILKAHPGVREVRNELVVMEAAAPQEQVIQQVSYGDLARTQQAATPKANMKEALFGDEAFSSKAVSQASYSPEAVAPAPPVGMSNQAKAQEIATVMEMAGIQGQDMEIRFKDGIATIHGAVFSPQQRYMAEQTISQIPGVSGVDNQLQLAEPYMTEPQMAQGMMPPQQMMGQQAMMPPPGYGQGSPYGQPQGYGQPSGPPMQPASYSQGMPMMDPAMGGAPSYQASATNKVYNQPNLPQHSWPTYAAYPNYAQVSYPKQYSASAFPYIGPFYPYPQVPLGWRKSSLVWEDGSWQLEFDSKTDRWWWFVHPKNW